MSARPIVSSAVLAACIGVLVVAATTPLGAERVAARRYSTADGLSGDYILSVRRDSRGFLWFGTRDGVCRFDGVRFVTYGMTHGLPTPTVYEMYETRDGRLWAATNGGGVARFDPRGGSRLFVTIPVGDDPATNRINVLYEDRAGHLWAGTDDGLFRGDVTAGDPVFTRVEIPTPQIGLRGVAAIVEDAEGSLWIGGRWGLLRRLPDGRSVVYRVEPAVVRDSANAILIDAAGRLWIGFRSGLFHHQPSAAASFTDSTGPIERVLTRRSVAPDRWYATTDGLPSNVVTALHLKDAELFVGTDRGLAIVDAQSRVRAIGSRQGISDALVTDITDDRSGSIWIGSVNGATRLIGQGLVTFDALDGLVNPRIYALGLDQKRRLVAVGHDYQISQFDGARFVSARPAIPGDAACQWLSRCGVLDRVGEWWIPTSFGLYRWRAAPSVGDLVRPADVRYDARVGLPDDGVFSAFEDREGNIWAGTNDGGVARWTRTTSEWQVFTAADGLPPLRRIDTHLTAFAQDRSGALWLGFDVSGLLRFRGGRFERFGADAGAPSGSITALHLDRDGRLWIGSSASGLARVEAPDAVKPVFQKFTAAEGLATNNVRCLVDDDRGRIYVCTTHGIDRLEPATGALRHFSTTEGLASNFVTSAIRDAAGALWFGTISGLSRLDVSDDRSSGAGVAPAVFIGSLTVAGVPQTVSEVGEVEPASVTMSPGRNQIEIGFFGFSFESGSPLRYQYRLGGAQTDWSAPTDLRSVNYARLSPGSYTFEVRAVRADGAVSVQPASVALRVMPPFYWRWWFIGIVAATAAGAVLALYRVRVAQLLRVERVRSRIATDLHDDIGASLSQIAILAEVARERLNHPPPGPASAEPAAAEPLARIAETSRGLVDSMSDIVWAINPEADSLGDLVHRMRRFAEDTLGAGDIELVFRAPVSSEDLPVGADVRREIFLILKESVTNIAKHANASRVAIDVESNGRRVWLRVADNGRGFDPGLATDGNGVASMRRRVAALGGRLEIESAPGRGTTITLDVERRKQ